MKERIGLCIALVLAGCEPDTPAASTDAMDVVGTNDTVESLAADPERLKEVQRRCKLNHDDVGDTLCSAASEAYRRRFMGGGARKDESQVPDSE